MRAIILAIFDDELKRVFGAKPEILKFLTRNERKNLCVDNICAQVIKSEKHISQHLLNIKNLEKYVRDLARIFASTCLNHKKEQLLSASAKSLKLAEINRMSDLEAKWDSIQAESLSSGITVYPTVSKSK